MEEESWLSIFEKAKMDKSNADRLTEAIEILHIPLRLYEDSSRTKEDLMTFYTSEVLNI